MSEKEADAVTGRGAACCQFLRRQRTQTCRQWCPLRRECEAVEEATTERPTTTVSGIAESRRTPSCGRRGTISADQRTKKISTSHQQVMERSHPAFQAAESQQPSCCPGRQQRAPPASLCAAWPAYLGPAHSEHCRHEHARWADKQSLWPAVMEMVRAVSRDFLFRDSFFADSQFRIEQSARRARRTTRWRQSS